MIRRLKQDVINNLPAKQREMKYVSVDSHYEPQLQLLEKQSQSLERVLGNTSGDITAIQQARVEARMILNQRYQITGKSYTWSYPLV